MSFEIVYDVRLLGRRVGGCNRGGKMRRNGIYERITVKGAYRKMELQKWQCQYCETGISFSNCVFDHIYPLGRGGNHTLNNIALTCESCNQTKGMRKLSKFCEKTGRDFFEIMGQIDDINVQLENEGFIQVEVEKLA